MFVLDIFLIEMCLLEIKKPVLFNIFIMSLPFYFININPQVNLLGNNPDMCGNPGAATCLRLTWREGITITIPLYLTTKTCEMFYGATENVILL